MTSDVEEVTYCRQIWKDLLNEQLTLRKMREEKPFEELINFCCRIFEGIALFNTNDIGNYRVNYSNIDINEQGSNLERIYHLQEELKEMLKRKDDQLQTINELRNEVITKEKEKSELRRKLQESNESLELSRKQVKCLQQELNELQKQIVFERDEHNALKIFYDDLNQKLILKTKEYNELIDLWKKKREEDIEKMNEENDKMERLRLEKKRKELEEAAKAMKVDDSHAHFPSEDKADPLSIEAQIVDKVLFQIEAHDGEVFALKWAHCESRFKGEILATGGSDRKVKLWKISCSLFEIQDTLIGSNGGITSIDIENDNLLASSNDFTSRVWSISDGKLRRTLTGHSDKVLTAKFLGVSHKVVSGSNDRTLRIWDFNKCACTRTLFAGSTCYDLVPRKGHEIIISAHFDKKIRFWDLRQNDGVDDILLDGKITSLDISPDGFYLLACVRDDTLKLLDLRMDQVVKTFCANGFKVGLDTTRATFSPDNNYVVSGSNNGAVFIWNVHNGQVEKTLKNQHSSTVTVSSWNNRGEYLASCDRNKKVIIWSKN